MTIYFSEAVNRAVVTCGTTVHLVNCKMVLKDCSMVMLDFRQRRRSVALVRDEKHLVWAAEPLRMRNALRIDGKPINQAQTIRLGRIMNISTEIVRRGKVSPIPYRVFSTMPEYLTNTTREAPSTRGFWTSSTIWYRGTSWLQTLKASMRVTLLFPRW